MDNLFCKNKQLEDLLEEKWADVFGYDGIYSVSNFGRIKREMRHDTLGRLLKPKILSRTVWKFKGVVQNAKITLCADTQKGTYSVSNLVYEAFNREIPKDMCVMHVDKDRTNDRLDNLKLVKYSESIRRDYEVENKKSDFGNWGNVGRNKGVKQLNDKGEIIDTYTSLGDVVKKTGYCKTSISDVCRGRYKKAYGYRWAYCREKEGGEKTFNTDKLPTNQNSENESQPCFIRSVSNSVCPLCHGTGYYSYGGSFGGAVQTERCSCGANCC